MTSQKHGPGSQPKRHHLIPRFYLDGFRDMSKDTGKKARVWMYRAGRDEPLLVNPSNVRVETHFYSTVSESGKFDASPEDGLGLVDGEASKIWPHAER